MFWEAEALWQCLFCTSDFQMKLQAHSSISLRKPRSLTDPWITELTKSPYLTGNTSKEHEVIVICSNDSEKAVIPHHTC